MSSRARTPATERISVSDRGVVGVWPEAKSAGGVPAMAGPSVRVLPSVSDLAFALVAMIVTLVGHHNILSSDGDVARHLRLGERMLEDRALLDHYPYTFLFPGKPFLPFEWGTEVVVALAHRIGGLAAVAGLAVVAIALTSGLIVLFLRRRGVDPLLSLVTGLCAAFFTAVQWVARPHLFTLLGVVLLLFLLEPRGRRRGWLALPLFAVWANMHGGFAFGLVMIGVYLAGDLAEWRFRKNGSIASRRLRYHGTVLVAALAGSMINPHGWKLYAHVFGFFADGEVIHDNTREFLSPDFHEPYMKLVLLGLIGLMGLLISSRRRIRPARILLILVSLGFLLLSMRNVPLFGVAAIPVAALHLNGEWKALRIPRLERIRATFRVGEAASQPGLWSLALVLGAVSLLALNGGRIPGGLLPDRFSAAKFPVAAVEHARGAGLRGRMFNEFSWGGYLMYAWPEQEVYIDGGTDFYGGDHLRTYLTVATLQPGWRDLLRESEISMAVLPSDMPLTHELAHDAEWTVWYCDDTAAILRRGEGRRSSAPPVGALAGCPEMLPVTPAPTTAR